MSASSRVRTVVTEQRQTLRLRVNKLQQQVVSEFETELEVTKREMEKSGLGADEIDKFVDSRFDKLNGIFFKCSNELREDVKAKKPKKPTGDDPKEQAEYEEQVREYKSYVEYALTIISRLTDFIKEVFEKIKEFFRSLWNWIKSKFQDIAKKVGEFVKFMKEKFGSLVDYIFG
ncbi:uncharacterized protein [Asterias amurensis]